MERSHPGTPLAELRNHFELLLEDLATLHAELQTLRRELQERQELSFFLLKAVVDDLASHCLDPAVHPPARLKRQGRPASRPCPHCPAPSSLPDPASRTATCGPGTA
jgi:hypothetical protein